MPSFAPLCCDSPTSKLLPARYGNLFCFLASAVSGRVGQARLFRTYALILLYRIGRRHDNGCSNYNNSHKYYIMEATTDPVQDFFLLADGHVSCRVVDHDRSPAQQHSSSGSGRIGDPSVRALSGECSTGLADSTGMT
jgi:hypothetical protein